MSVGLGKYALFSVLITAVVVSSMPTAAVAQARQRDGSATSRATAPPPALLNAIQKATAESGRDDRAPEALPPAEVAPIDCPPNSTATLVPASAVTACIAETATSTRWNLGYAWSPAGPTAVPCIKDPRALVPFAVYKVQDCRPGKIFAENTAQARVVAQLNARGVYGDSSLLGITANLQWETTVPGTGERPDLLLYDRGNPTGAVGLVEMKGTWSDDDPIAEVAHYVQTWPHGVRPVVPYHFSTPIDDHFEVELDPACKEDPSVHSAYLYHTYSDPAHDGVIWVHQDFRPCPERKKQNQEEEAEGTYEGTIGADADNNGVDDFWDYVAAHPALWYIPASIPYGIAVYRLAQPIFVRFTPEMLAFLEENIARAAAADAVDAAWAEIVASMPELAATSADLIAAGDAAALGMEGVELAAAGAALDAGFITVGLAVSMFAVVAIIAVIILAIVLWHIYGDPHLATLDGLHYDLQAVGEFHLVRVPGLGLDVQGRYAPLAGSSRISLIKAVSFTINGAIVELLPNGVAYVNDHPVPASQNLVDLGNGAALMRDGNRFVATLGSGVLLAYDGSRFGFNVPPGVPTTGLLGNNNGVAGDDLAYPDGTHLSSSDPSVIHGPYADSWRVTEADTLFTYNEDQDPSAYTDLAFPSNVTTLADFPRADLDIARQTCTDEDVVVGPQLDACMLDVAETGDAHYAQAAAAVTSFLQDPGAHLLDANGDVTETFEGAIGENFRPNSTMTIDGATVAGPVFDGSGYGFSVPSLPHHGQAAVAFDVYTVGLATGTGSLAVKLTDPALSTVVSFTPTGASVTSGPGTITSVGQGQTAQGAAYRRYRLSITGTHYSEQLRVQLEPTGFRGLIGTSLAVDSIAVHVTAVPPQTFSAALPLIVSDGAVNGAGAAGAGNLESNAAADVYTVTVPGPGDYLGISFIGCPAATGSVQLSWNLVSATGSTVGSGHCDSDELGYLPGGTYTLTVAGPGVVGTYGLSLRTPQRIASSLPLAASGSFTDGAASNAYAFSVPEGGKQLALSLRSCPTQSYWTRARWSLTDASTRRELKSGGCAYADLGVVPAGDYVLLVSAGGTGGTYTLDVAGPQSFDVALPLIVGDEIVNGTPTPGAGRFEGGASQDVYAFTVPAGGQTLGVNVSACPTASYLTYLNWTLLNDAGATVARGGCSYTSLADLPGGAYRLMVSASGLPGAYAVNVEAPQSFAVTTPVAVAADTVNGTATAGAGRFETSASQDIYTFTVPTGGQALNLNIAACPVRSYLTYLEWHLLTDSGATVTSGRCDSVNLGTLAAGAYRLVVDAGGLSGTYTVNLEAPQSFAVTIPLAATANTINGVAATGAANFETTASQDIYTFTVPAGGQVLSLNAANCPVQSYLTYLNWQLLNSSGAVVKSGRCEFKNLGTVAAGDYRLVVDAGGIAGAYALSVVPSQTFATTLPLAVTSNTVNGSAVSGAGNLETGASQDIYTFTVPAGGRVLNLNAGHCPVQNYLTSLRWSLLDGSGHEVSNGGCSYVNLGTVAAGDYRIVVNANGVPGSYDLAVESPQTFMAAVPLAVSADTVNAAAATGAGRFETGASEDIYPFTVPAGGLMLTLNVTACPVESYLTPMHWKLLAADGTSVATGSCGTYSLGSVAAGDYRLVSDAGGVAGTYAVSLVASQLFTVTIPLAVTANTINGTAATGAGSFETGAAQDIYKFTGPAGGIAAAVAVSACPSSGSVTYLGWKLLTASGTVVKTGSCGYTDLGTLAAGDYQLVANANGLAGTYAVNLEPPQTFAATVPMAVSANTINGTATAGAGTFETGASRDIYTFTVPAGGQDLNLNVSACPTSSYVTYLGWKIVNSAGTTVKSGNCNYYNIGTLPAGDYRLVAEAKGLPGAYAVVMEQPQTFAPALPLAVTADTVNGTATAGAGRFETTASQDVYTVTVPAGGQILNISVGACPTSSYVTYLTWKLLDGSGATVKSGNCNYYNLGTIAAGSYRLVVNSGGVSGTYSLAMEQRQTFAAALPLSVAVNTVNGTAVSGAGNMETGASQDVYGFTVPAGGQALTATAASCPVSSYVTYLKWKLLDASGATVKSGGCSSYSLGTIAAGNYQLVVDAGGLAGSYTVSVQ